MEKKLTAKPDIADLISLDSLSLGDVISISPHVNGQVISIVKEFEGSKFICTSYLIVENPEDETDVYFFPLFETEQKEIQAFMVRSQKDVDVFLDYMKDVSKNIKINNINNFIKQIHHEISIDSDKGKYYMSCKGTPEKESIDE